MATKIGGQSNVKIFVLYLMQNVNYPLDYVSINDIVMRTDYVMYLDFAEAFNELIDRDLIRAVDTNEYGDPLYIVTDNGKLVAEQLHSDILPKILDDALTGALLYLDFRKRGIEAHSSVEKNGDGTYQLTCELMEGKKSLMKVSLAVDSQDRAERMRAAFQNHPDGIYRSELALMSGSMNFLFNGEDAHG